MLKKSEVGNGLFDVGFGDEGDVWVNEFGYGCGCDGRGEEGEGKKRLMREGGCVMGD